MDDTLELLQAEIELFGGDDEVAVGVLRQAAARIEALEAEGKRLSRALYEALTESQELRVELDAERECAEALEAALRPLAVRGHDAIIVERAVAKGRLTDEHRLQVRTTVGEVNAASTALREPGAGEEGEWVMAWYKPIIGIRCDNCEDYAEAELTLMETGQGWDDRNVDDDLRAKGWVFTTKGQYCCQDCADAAAPAPGG